MNVLAGGVNKLRIANIVGILILFLGMFGINVDEGTREIIISALGALGLIINQVITEYNARKGTMLSDKQAEKSDVTTVTPQTIQGDVSLVSTKAIKNQTGVAGFARVDTLWGSFGIAMGLLLVLSLMSGCAGNQQVTVQDSIATGYTLIKSTAQDVSIAKRNQIINQATADEFAKELQKAQDALDVARETLPVNLDTAALKSAYAREIINVVILALQRANPTKIGAPE